MNTLLKGLNEKYVLKKIAGGLFPKEIAERSKHPFFAPLKYFYLKENQEPIKHYIEQARLATPWLNWSHIDRLMGLHLNINSPLFNLQNSTRILLFSLGVLVEHLRADPPLIGRGFHIPTKVEELLPYKRF